MSSLSAVRTRESMMIIKTWLLMALVVLVMSACSAPPTPTPRPTISKPMLTQAEAIGSVQAYLGTKTYTRRFTHPSRVICGSNNRRSIFDCDEKPARMTLKSYPCKIEGRFTASYESSIYAWQVRTDRYQWTLFERTGAIVPSQGQLC